MTRMLMTRAKLTALLVCLGVVAMEARAEQPPAAAAPASAEAPKEKSETARFQGVYTYIGGEKERTELGAAVDLVTADFFLIKRIIAGRRIHARNPVFNTLSLSFPEGMIEFKTDDNVLKSPANGDIGTAKSSAGDDAKISQTFKGDRLVQVFEIDNATRRNELMLSPDGSELIMTVKVTSPQFDKPLDYRLTYRRSTGK
jgi:hypothetical protein